MTTPDICPTHFPSLGASRRGHEGELSGYILTLYLRGDVFDGFSRGEGAGGEDFCFPAAATLQGVLEGGVEGVEDIAGFAGFGDFEFHAAFESQSIADGAFEVAEAFHGEIFSE